MDPEIVAALRTAVEVGDGAELRRLGQCFLDQDPHVKRMASILLCAAVVDAILAFYDYRLLTKSAVNHLIEVAIEVYGSIDTFVEGITQERKMAKGLLFHDPSRSMYNKLMAVQKPLRVWTYLVEEGYVETHDQLTRLDALFDELSLVEPRVVHDWDDEDSENDETEAELTATLAATVHLLGLLRWNPLRRAWVQAVVTAPVLRRPDVESVEPVSM